MVSTATPTLAAAGADELAAAAAGPALLGARTPALAAIDVAGAALVATGLAATAALERGALFEDFLLAQPATKKAATPTEAVALIAAELARITFFISELRTWGSL